MHVPEKQRGGAFRVGTAAVVWALCALAPTVADAQRPADVAEWEPSDALHVTPTFSPLPADYVSERRGNVEWVYPRAAERVVLELQDAYGEAWERIGRDLGERVDDDLTIRIGRDPDEMANLAPEGRPPPGYAAGVAYPRMGTILLTLSAPDTWERPQMEKILTHELSHVALYRAVNGHRLPRWFVEGVAIYQAGENNWGRVQTLATATIAGNLVSLRRIDRSFPSRPHRVNVAYAQSADMVGFMRSERGDVESFHDLVDHLAEGVPFEEAVELSYGARIEYLEQKWRDELRERYRAMPLLLSGTGVWFLMSLLLVLAWARRRRQHRERTAVMAAEEAAQDEALDRAAAVVQEQLREREDDGPLILVTGDPPQGRDSDVPTVEYDGQNHTLH
jgi:hypothetical protein